MTDKMFMEVQDVIEILNISEGKAYEIIRMLNAELKEKGYIVVRGKVYTTRNRRWKYVSLQRCDKKQLVCKN